jgi:hypothetical protein
VVEIVGMTYYTDEHTRVASILYRQWVIANDSDPNAMLIRTKLAREAINSILIGLAVMYRDQNPTFDFPRFLRECRQGAQ